MKECCDYIEKFKQTGIWNENTTGSASWNGDLDCLKYARENGCPWQEETTSYAAIRNHLNCLKYAHENDCPWNIKTTEYAVGFNHLDCLKYAIKNGCPWDEKNSFFVLNKYASSIIDLDDKWWRTFLFDKDLSKYSSIERVVNAKKEEIKQLQASSEILFSYTPKDVIKYVLWPYF